MTAFSTSPCCVVPGRDCLHSTNRQHDPRVANASNKTRLASRRRKENNIGRSEWPVYPRRTTRTETTRWTSNHLRKEDALLKMGPTTHPDQPTPTREAAHETKEIVAAAVAAIASRPTITTHHSVGPRILKTLQVKTTTLHDLEDTPNHSHPSSPNNPVSRSNHSSPSLTLTLEA